MEYELVLSNMYGRVFTTEKAYLGQADIETDQADIPYIPCPGKAVRFRGITEVRPCSANPSKNPPKQRELAQLPTYHHYYVTC